MKFAVGTKQYMTQVFDEKGIAYPVTVIAVAPMQITQIKTKEKDGYTAVQIGAGAKKESKVNKAQKSKGNFNVFKEFRMDDTSAHTVGEAITASTFAVGDVVEVAGITKGKGFQGVVKRHGFHGGSRTHGQKHSEREPGSIGGAGRAGGRVVLGMRMGGRMGGDRVTVKNLKVIKIVPETREIFISGAIPGRRGNKIEIKKTNS